MKKSPPLTAPANATVLAKLGTNFGYCFDADTVALTACFRVLTPIAHQRSWILQLWACPAAPLFPDKLQGQLIARAVLPPLAEIADPVETFTVQTSAQLPAGTAEHVMVLALVTVSFDGLDVAEVHDVAIFPHRETFALPRLVGASIHAMREGNVVVTAAAIENPRTAANRSGTLSLELWALPVPYRGGEFAGSPVAGAALGTLDGQTRWTNLELTLPTVLPPEPAQFVLMLREWTAAGYVTRDYVNLGAQVIAPVTELAPSAPEIAVSAKLLVKPAVARKPARPAKVAVNTATEAELAAVKGLSRAAAKSIVGSRPYAKLNDLIKAKGIGPKLLAKIRSRLRLN